MDNIALVVNTHSSYGDLWEMFFDKKREHFPDIKTYVFSDSGDFEPEHTVVYYDRRKNFRSQFLSCIGSVQEEYCIFVSEDYILCDHPDEGLLTKYTNILEEHKYLSFIRLLKGASFGEPNFKGHPDLYELSNVLPYFYSQSAALWRTKDLQTIFAKGPDLHIAGTNEDQQFEIAANKVCNTWICAGFTPIMESRSVASIITIASCSHTLQQRLSKASGICPNILRSLRPY